MFAPQKIFFFQLRRIGVAQLVGRSIGWRLRSPRNFPGKKNVSSSLRTPHHILSVAYDFYIPTSTMFGFVSDYLPSKRRTKKNQWLKKKFLACWFLFPITLSRFHRKEIKEGGSRWREREKGEGEAGGGGLRQKDEARREEWCGGTSLFLPKLAIVFCSLFFLLLFPPSPFSRLER